MNAGGGCSWTCRHDGRSAQKGTPSSLPIILHFATPDPPGVGHSFMCALPDVSSLSHPSRLLPSPTRLHQSLYPLNMRRGPHVSHSCRAQLNPIDLGTAAVSTPKVPRREAYLTEEERHETDKTGGLGPLPSRTRRTRRPLLKTSQRVESRGWRQKKLLRGTILPRLSCYLLARNSAQLPQQKNTSIQAPLKSATAPFESGFSGLTGRVLPASLCSCCCVPRPSWARTARARTGGRASCTKST